jgi:hypothetical protein
LGGEDVTQLVGMSAHTGVAGDALDDAPDEVAVEGAAVISDEAAVSADVVHSAKRVNEVGVRGNVAVVA